MWRLATESDAPEIVNMCLALYAEDPSGFEVTAESTERTLQTLREEPVRGRALILQDGSEIAGYALLISFWSNELGGQIVVIDELFVKPSFRNRGHARELLTSLGSQGRLWPGEAVALELEVTSRNLRASALYTRLGFRPVKNQRMRRLRGGA